MSEWKKRTMYRGCPWPEIVAAVVFVSVLLIVLTGCGEPDALDKQLDSQYRYCVAHGGSFSQDDNYTIRCDMPEGTK